MPQHNKALIKQRAAELREAVNGTRQAWLNSLLGKPLEVLAEKDGTGYAPQFARVALPSGTKPGSLVQVTPTQLHEGLLQ